MNLFSIFFKRKRKTIPKNPYTIDIPNCKGNRFVISDVHGCLKTLIALVKSLNIKADDQVFLLGDYIDKGIDSVGVLDYLIELKKQYQVYPIMGNHEDDLLVLLEFKSESMINRYMNKQNTHTMFQPDYSLKESYKTFIEELPYFIVLDEFILVHAGFDFAKPLPFENIEEMVWIRGFQYDSNQAMNKKIIHGHTPCPLPEIISKIDKNEEIIPLDNGCVFSDAENFGNLLCLNLTTRELIIQKNVEDN